MLSTSSFHLVLLRCKKLFTLPWSHGAGVSFHWDACLSSRRHCRKVYEAAHTHTHTQTAWAMLPLTFINKPTEGKRTEKQNDRERERERPKGTDRLIARQRQCHHGESGSSVSLGWFCLVVVCRGSVHFTGCANIDKDAIIASFKP